MSKYVIMPYDDYKGACNTIRAASGKTSMIKSGDMSSEIKELVDNPKLEFKLCTLPDTGSSTFKMCMSCNDKIILLYNDIVLYSTDGVNWSQSTLPCSGNWKHYAYGNGKLVVLNNDTGSARAIYSEDGINWNTCNLTNLGTSFTTASFFTNIIYGNGIFVALYYSSRKLTYSNDGINWYTTTNMNTINTKSSCPCAYGNGKFIINFNGLMIYSTDGVNWNIIDNDSLSSIQYKYGKFVSLANNQAFYSYDGINWESGTLPDGHDMLMSYTYGNGIFIAYGYSQKKIMYSEDGIVWKYATYPSEVSKLFKKMFYINGRFIAIQENSKAVAYSYDGINWGLGTLPVIPNSYSDIVDCDGKCVILGNNYEVMYCNLNVGIK